MTVQSIDPVPIIDPASYAGSYRGVPVDETDPRFSEPLVPLASVGVAYDGYYARTDGANPPFSRPLDGARKDGWIRKSMSQKLAAANDMLRPLGVGLLILDAYRPFECQRSLWDFHFDQARIERPGAGAAKWRSMALQRAADPDAIEIGGAIAWPAHTTGGAVDTTLRDLRSGKPLDMGSHFEEVTDISYTDYFERQLERRDILADDPRLLHRRMLHWSLSAQGLLNDPFVVWHYDWGNQLYVKNRRAMFNDRLPAAWYGCAQPPPD